MPTEIEAKFRLAEPDAVRQQLLRGGARLAGRVLETDLIFDTPDNRLRRADCGLRIRSCRLLAAAGQGASAYGPTRLTYKGPRAAGDIKTREELEATIEDAGVFIAMLERLGFRETVVYEKRREIWYLASCEIAVDELPRLGWWIEIEGPDAAAVEGARARLGLTHAPPVRETYVEMAAAHGRPDAQGCRRLMFGEDRPTAEATVR